MDQKEPFYLWPTPTGRAISRMVEKTEILEKIHRKALQDTGVRPCEICMKQLSKLDKFCQGPTTL